ncbi:MAG: ribulose-phosphate 3-epimerase [Candidatus Cloacimonadota bacterium]|nr:MAG: ribulose-phosphate 3-epimerase [Candidatus Cloacimonadota bacterium]PIE79468.1 MAG: ribulose-phosphate 3-epimerase [Candidatus Delongbacteria bacterium]
MVFISPSLLSADFSKLGEEIKSCEESGADYLHLDIMDGHFVPNITFGPFIVNFCNKVSKLPLDVHLMIENPEKYIPDFVKAGADIITIHAEAVTHLHRQIQLIKSLGVKAGVALNPHTPLECLEYLIDDLDMVLLMSVNPGFSGQKFIPQILDKLDHFNERFSKRVKDGFLLQVDGGVDGNTHKLLKDKGVNMLVSGSYFFNHQNRKEAIEILKS